MENRTIFVDVDGTLIICGKTNEKLIEWLKIQKTRGYSAVLWSMRGASAAKEVAVRLGISDLFEAIVSKPRFIIDDQGWNWIRYCGAIHLDAIERGENLCNVKS